ncbi:MAG: hypothetical protein ACJAZO_000476 [Myxococcota bacterium]
MVQFGSSRMSMLTCSNTAKGTIHERRSPPAAFGVRSPPYRFIRRNRLTEAAPTSNRSAISRYVPSPFSYDSLAQVWGNRLWQSASRRLGHRRTGFCPPHPRYCAVATPCRSRRATAAVSFSSALAQQPNTIDGGPVLPFPYVDSQLSTNGFGAGRWKNGDSIGTIQVRVVRKPDIPGGEDALLAALEAFNAGGRSPTVDYLGRRRGKLDRRCCRCVGHGKERIGTIRHPRTLPVSPAQRPPPRPGARIVTPPAPQWPQSAPSGLKTPPRREDREYQCFRHGAFQWTCDDLTRVDSWRCL